MRVKLFKLMDFKRSTFIYAQLGLLLIFVCTCAGTYRPHCAHYHLMSCLPRVSKITNVSFFVAFALNRHTLDTCRMEIAVSINSKKLFLTWKIIIL